MILDLSAIHITSEFSLPNSLTIRAIDPNRDINLNFKLLIGIYGFVASLPRAGTYEVQSSDGSFCHGGDPTFVIGLSESYFADVQICDEPSKSGAVSAAFIFGTAGGALVLFMVLIAVVTLVFKKKYKVEAEIVNSRALLDSDEEAETMKEKPA
jgi:cbb3-type cytochrome oxidase subunit 3